MERLEACSLRLEAYEVDLDFSIVGGLSSGKDLKVMYLQRRECSA